MRQTGNTHTRAPQALSRWQRFLYFFFYKLGLTSWDIEQSRWFWYRLGISVGEQSHPPVIYGPHCERHGVAAMACMKCYSPQVPAVFPDYEPITDPHVIPAKRYTNMREQGAGSHTAAVASMPRFVTKPLHIPKLR